MRLHGTVLRMRDLLLERGVTLTPGHADADAVYEGPGAQAREAWAAFRAVAVEPAFDPVEADGELQEVESAGFLLRRCSPRAGRPATEAVGCRHTTS